MALTVEQRLARIEENIITLRYLLDQTLAVLEMNRSGSGDPATLIKNFRLELDELGHAWFEVEK